MMDKRKNANTAKLDQVRACLTNGDSVESISVKFNMSTSHIYRIKTAMHKGQVKLKPSSLASCLKFIHGGFPFRRLSWSDDVYNYYDPEFGFVKCRPHCEPSEVLTYTVDLSAEDLSARDWVVLTWDSVKHGKDTPLDVSNVK
jgi:hypothetical protein